MKRFFLGSVTLFACGLIAGTVLVASGSAWSQSAPVWRPLAEEIARIIDKAETSYRAGDAKAARRAVIEAYFGVFEDRKMEAAMRTTIGARHTYLVEKQFAELRRKIKNGESADKIHRLAEEIRIALRRDAKVLDQAGVPAEVFKVKQ